MKRWICVIFVGLLAAAVLSGCFGEPEQEEIWELHTENVVIFSDGEAVSCWRLYEGRTREPVAYYKLTDGTVIMTESDHAGEDSLPGLGTDAQKVAAVYFARKGDRYDMEQLLQDAYARYKSCLAAGEEYQPGAVSQQVVVTAQNETYCMALTTVVEAADPKNASERQYGAVFNRESGQAVDVWSLFTVPESEAREALVAQAVPSLQEELAAAIGDESFIFYPDHLEVYFPAEALSSISDNYDLTLEYSALDGILQPEAVPNEA